MNGIRVLVSSKYLHLCLSRFDFGKGGVVRVVLQDDKLTILGYEQSVDVIVSTVNFYPSLKQNETRWDWVKETVGLVNEQPVVLHIFENTVNVIFQY